MSKRINQDTKEIKIKNCDVFENDFMKLERKEGIVFGTYKKKNITLDMAKEVVKNRLAFSQQKDVPTLVTEQGLKGIERDARQFLGSEEGVKGVKAGAIVTKSVVSSHLANFFIRVSIIRTRVPMRLFTSEKEAVKWLKQFLDE
tara:strand:- start:481 stop:912 length:432 start_codon:yes stop_codon:yes gene_type:complete